MTQCSTQSKSRSRYYTCLDKKDLLEIAEAYNQDSKRKTKKQLYMILQNKFKKTEDKWWMYKKIPEKIRMKLKYIIYKPEAPSGGDKGWLSSKHINSLVLQNTTKSNNFVYYGVFSSDFFISKPHHINLIKNILRKGENIGLVFNTTPEKHPGEHWVSVYISNDNTYFFDPTGDTPNENIKSFLYNFKNVVINKTKYQRKDGTCGLYAVEYLTLKSQKKPIVLKGDDIINKKRKKYFFKAL